MSPTPLGDNQTQDDSKLSWKDTVAFIIAAFSLVFPFMLIVLSVFVVIFVISRFFI
jgi:hypothetical protein